MNSSSLWMGIDEIENVAYFLFENVVRRVDVGSAAAASAINVVAQQQSAWLSRLEQRPPSIVVYDGGDDSDETIVTVEYPYRVSLPCGNSPLNRLVVSFGRGEAPHWTSGVFAVDLSPTQVPFGRQLVDARIGRALWQFNSAGPVCSADNVDRAHYIDARRLMLDSDGDGTTLIEATFRVIVHESASSCLVEDRSTSTSTSTTASAINNGVTTTLVVEPSSSSHLQTSSAFMLCILSSIIMQLTQRMTS
jgi:hypothetical protein